MTVDTTFAPRERLDGQTAVITGGNGAIGAAAARRFAALGARVVLIARSPVEASAALLASLAGDGHFALSASVTDSAALVAAAAEVERRTGGATIVVNSAGYTKPVPTADLDALTDDFIDEMFAVNWRGPFATIRAFAPQLKRAGEGVVVNVSSIAAFSGLGSNLAYSASKGALDTLTKGLAKTMAPGIRFVAVSPGLVDTPFVPGRDAAFNERVGPKLPLKRLALADDVAAAIQACVTTLCFATGSIFIVDGGRHLG
jgi:3-oxoacyl-[acyl-carrier protein] reductase